MYVIETDKLTKRYGQRVGVDSVSLAIPSGAIFGFLGPNGAGKTTTIRLLLALLRPTEGAARVFGLDCWRHASRIKRDLGYVPGDLRLYHWMTTRSALAIVGKVRGQDLTSAGVQLAREFNLELDVRVRNMSRGTRQKLGLLLAMVHRPRLLVLDEPTSALDPLMQQTFYDHLRQRAREGATVFVSSHTLSEVDALCDRAAILRNGQVVANERLDVMRRRAARDVTVEFATEQACRTTEVPDLFAVARRTDRSWHGTLTGSAVELVAWAARQPLSDVTIGQPDLDSLFRQYYQPQDAAS